MRYILFGGDIYYAKGGVHDYLGQGTTVDVMVSRGITLRKAGEISWWHLWDSVDRKFIAASPDQALGSEWDWIELGYSVDFYE